MKLLVIGDEDRFWKYLPKSDFTSQVDCVVVPRGTDDDKIIAAAPDADFILSDTICTVSGQVIAALPNLKLVHTEGVAYNMIDVKAARDRGIPVCNCKGCNDGAVAEQAILLMLACLRDAVSGDEAVRAGRQIETKEAFMKGGLRELGDCKVGLIGAGDTGKATMRRLVNWNCPVTYYKRTPLSPQEEQELNASYEPLDQLLATSDIVSLHVPVTGETQGMVDSAFIGKMKKGSLLINTARGAIVDNQALADALVLGHLGGAGLDTLDPEPVTVDNILLNLPGDASRRIVFSPHMGGITEGTFLRVHSTVWENFSRVARGEQPINIVN